MPQWLSPDTESAAALLEAHPDYRVLRSLPPLDLLPLPAPEGRLRTAAIIDTETTSLDPATGSIIELAICAVTFDGRGRIVGIGPVHDWLEDPGHPLPSEIVKLTGLCDQDLSGQRIDDARVVEMLSTADLIVAHNARFDATWIEQRYSSLAGQAWCCSLTDVDWRGLGYEGRQLGALLGEAAGFFNGRHRADSDVAALVALLTTTLSSGRTACSEMILSAQRPTVRIIAEGARFEVKDRLKARAYKWDQNIRRWGKEVTSNSVDEERAWLAEQAGCRNPSMRDITWYQRHRV
ncbi:3'-5' exonuclease [Sphingomonas panacisoli]|uniref:3'-5' exonuclease n=1 Tax=Sphingomonas panacisoli TaxID=1813879 RepID=UPI001645EE07|nr:3'-5' exonuclease [Sphingomonas panacisoli]